MDELRQYIEDVRGIPLPQAPTPDQPVSEIVLSLLDSLSRRDQVPLPEPPRPDEEAESDRKQHEHPEISRPTFPAGGIIVTEGPFGTMVGADTQLPDEQILESPLDVYKLTNCDDDSDIAYTSTDLSDDVDKVIQWKGLCWQVEIADPSELPCASPNCIDVEGHFDDCDECAQCYTLTPCSAGSTIYTNYDLSDSVGKTVLLDDGNCYDVSVATDCEDATYGITIEETYENCDECDKCYVLENCNDDTDTITVTNDLAALTELTSAEMVAAGTTFEVDGKCYYVEEQTGTCGSAYYEDQLAPGSAIIHTDCAECGCLQLTECGGGATSYVVDDMIDTDGSPVTHSEVIGKVVRLHTADGDDTDKGKCYAVTQAANCTSAVSAIIRESYANCDACDVYTLTECGTATTITTDTDLVGLGYAIGDIIEVSGVCYTITNATGTFGGSTSLVTVQSGPWPSCDVCNANQQYQLANDCHLDDCGSSPPTQDNIITTERSLYDAVGKYVKVDGFCYKVSTVSGEAVTHSNVEYDGPFQTCDACLEAPVNASIDLVTDAELDTTNNKVLLHRVSLQITDGKITGLCTLSDTELTGTDCP